MKKNVGNADRWTRMGLGIFIILLGLVYGSWWGLIGLSLVLTGALNWCPAYLPFGLSTCRTEFADVQNEAEEQV